MLRLKYGFFVAVRYHLRFPTYHHFAFFFFFFLFKDSELNELRKTIELLKKQNAAAQAAINGVINTPELNCKGEKQAPRIATVQRSWDFRPLGNSWCNHQRSALSHHQALVACFGTARRFEMGTHVNRAVSSTGVNGCVGHMRRRFNKAFTPSARARWIYCKHLVTRPSSGLGNNREQRSPFQSCRALGFIGFGIFSNFRHKIWMQSCLISLLLLIPVIHTYIRFLTQFWHRFHSYPGPGAAQPTDLRIRRQHSSDSVSSINSATSHSSVGSNIESDSKKKKRKNWVSVFEQIAWGWCKIVRTCTAKSSRSAPPSSPRATRQHKDYALFKSCVNSLLKA